MNGEMAAILQSSRFSSDFVIQSNEPEPSSQAAPQVSFVVVACMLLV